MTVPIEHRRPFSVGYTHDGRTFSFILEGPATWAEAEAHLRSIRTSSWVEGSNVETIETNLLTLWIDGLAMWLKARWRNRRLAR